jgi:hypothetical protein
LTIETVPFSTGNLFILFAPHVGISENGNVGEYSRLGQSHDGKACGAAAAGTNVSLSYPYIWSNIWLIVCSSIQLKGLAIAVPI